MARKKSSPTRPGGLSLIERINQIVVAVGDGTLSPPQWMKLMGIYADGARAGEALFWLDVEAGTAGLPEDADMALLMLALYTKVALETIPGTAPSNTEVPPNEVVPIMQQILNLPGWEPSARWPFSKEEMAMNIHRYGPYLIPGFDVVPKATEIIKSKMKKMN